MFNSWGKDKEACAEATVIQYLQRLALLNTRIWVGSLTAFRRDQMLSYFNIWVESPETMVDREKILLLISQLRYFNIGENSIGT